MYIFLFLLISTFAVKHIIEALQNPKQTVGYYLGIVTAVGVMSFAFFMCTMVIYQTAWPNKSTPGFLGIGAFLSAAFLAILSLIYLVSQFFI